MASVFFLKLTYLGKADKPKNCMFYQNIFYNIRTFFSIPIGLAGADQRVVLAWFTGHTDAGTDLLQGTSEEKEIKTKLYVLFQRLKFL